MERCPELIFFKAKSFALSTAKESNAPNYVATFIVT
jgi:hypothetical protein